MKKCWILAVTVMIVCMILPVGIQAASVQVPTKAEVTADCVADYLTTLPVSDADWAAAAAATDYTKAVYANMRVAPAVTWSYDEASKIFTLNVSASSGWGWASNVHGYNVADVKAGTAMPAGIVVTKADGKTVVPYTSHNLLNNGSNLRPIGRGFVDPLTLTFENVETVEDMILWLCGTGSATKRTAKITIDFQDASAEPSEIASGTCGENLTWVLTDDGTLTISGTGAMAEWNSTSAVPWYSYSNSIEKVVIESGVTSVGKYAFYSCSKIYQVTIPEGVTSIGHAAFFHCNLIEEITIPASVTSIASGPFGQCYSLKNITVSENNAHYCDENGVLFNKVKTELVRYPAGKTETAYTIPAGVVSIGSQAFRGAVFTEITIPDTVTSIESSVFFGCTKLTGITIPASVTSIDFSLFDYCTALTSITVASANAKYCDIDGVVFSKDKTTIHEYPAGKAATEYVIPSSVTSIGNYAFSYCTNLAGITVPDSVTSIGKNAFSGCKNLAGISIPSSVTSIGWYAFSNCSILTSVTIPDSVTSIGNHAFSFCSSLTSVTIPAGVTSIGFNVFNRCTNLSSVTILNSDAVIDANAFNYCPNLTLTGYTGSTAETYANANNIPFVSLGQVPVLTVASGTCGENLTWVLTDDGTLTISGTGEMTKWNGTAQVPWDSYRKAIKQVVIESDVTSIGGGAFSNCMSLTAITIPDSVTSIGDGAFSSCTSLTGITVDDANANYCDIDGVLYTKDMTVLHTYPCGKTASSYAIPDSVSSIGPSAFWDCGKLTDITIPGNVTFIGATAFTGCDGLTAITIPASVTSIGRNAFQNCEKLTDITVDSGNANYCDIDGVLYTKDMTVLHTYPYGKTASSYVIPDSVTSIGDFAFVNCKKLTDITIPSSVTSIGGYAFSNCSSLVGITIPDSVTSIGDNAFRNCRNLTSVTIPDSVTSIGWYAFSNCSILTSVTIPDSVTSIGNYAFQSCTNLSSVTILNSDAVINKYVFNYCPNLTLTGYTGSTAETYASANNIPFVSLGYLPITGVKLDKKVLSMFEGGTGTLTATVIPSSAANKAVIWSSSDETVVSVSDGKVTALKPGTAVITAATVDGGFSDTCTVTVYTVKKGQSASGEVLPGTPAIDGKVDDVYKQSLTILSGDYPMQVIAGHNEGWDMTMTATTYALYDDDYLYICSDVKDDDVVSPADSYMAGTNPYNMDGIEYRLCMTEGNTVKVSVDAFGKRCFGLAAHELLFDYSTIRYKTTVTDDGYVLELAIPREGIFAMPDDGPFGIKVQLGDLKAEAAGTKPKEKANFFAWLPVPDGDEGITMPVNYTVSSKSAETGDSDVTISTEAPDFAVKGSTFTYTVSLAGTYDGFSFDLYPADGMRITGITAANSSINVDAYADHWMVSVLGGMDRSNADKETIVTVTAEVSEDALIGWRELSLSNVMISTASGDKATVAYDYASIAVYNQLLGDINGDLLFDYYDVAKLYAYYRSKTTLDPWIFTDINGDGVFDYYDVAKLYAVHRGKSTF